MHYNYQHPQAPAAVESEQISKGRNPPAMERTAPGIRFSGFPLEYPVA